MACGPSGVQATFVLEALFLLLLIILALWWMRRGDRKSLLLAPRERAQSSGVNFASDDGVEYVC